ncbi:MAG TPA: MarR family transcriptional regulator [Tahibacter sp.]|uniref:MarR family winged helix-turn-helix transcriptional regulator n=1 Tax=Tahibacter sp. TaxID=2056211 RepID=UPI002C459E03|nr:MarR family transcriptional regulator [Tahibacter sp.]HSX58602.1 MarR family transcriptional regulator [Tahibacter sp.]
MNSTDPRSNFAYPLMDVTRLLRKHFDRRAEPLGLTRAQWRAIKIVHRQPGISQKALAELLEMEPIPVGRVIDRLQQAGFVERRPDPNDRRVWRLHTLPRAHGVLDDMEVIAAGLRDDTLTGIADAELIACLGVLERMKQNLLALEDAASKNTNEP